MRHYSTDRKKAKGGKNKHKLRQLIILLLFFHKKTYSYAHPHAMFMEYCHGPLVNR